MSLTVTEIVTKILAAFGGSESRGQGIRKNVVIDLKALAFCRTTCHTPLQDTTSS